MPKKNVDKYQRLALARKQKRVEGGERCEKKKNEEGERRWSEQWSIFLLLDVGYG